MDAAPADGASRAGGRAFLPYVLPFGLYMAFLVVQGRFTPADLVWLYPLKTLVVAAALFGLRKSYVELHPWRSSSWLLAVLTGSVAIAIWIALDPFYPGLSRLMGDSPAAPFDPTTIANPTTRLLFLAFRVLGAVALVPLMEELFWRGFLIRWLVKDDFRSVPVGTYTALSFAATVALFGLEHEQWLAGIICGALYNGLLYRTKSLWACVVAHATSNALLAAWVLTRGDFKFW